MSVLNLAASYLSAHSTVEMKTGKKQDTSASKPTTNIKTIRRNSIEGLNKCSMNLFSGKRLKYGNKTRHKNGKY